MLPTHVGEITWDLDMFSIWCMLFRDMTSLIHHVVEAMNLVRIFRDRAQSTPSSQDDVLGSTHHDSLPPGPLV